MISWRAAHWLVKVEGRREGRHRRGMRCIGSGSSNARKEEEGGGPKGRLGPERVFWELSPADRRDFPIYSLGEK